MPADTDQTGEPVRRCEQRAAFPGMHDGSAIEDQYQQFIEEFSDAAPADVLARQVELVHAWRRFPAVDPVLPRELLPARWSGLRAARLFADRHQRWSGEARQEWKRLNDLG